MLDYFDVVNIETGEIIATAAGEGDYKRVRWRKKFQDRISRMSGRDEEGMAL